jgi:hypothetical protein
MGSDADYRAICQLKARYFRFLDTKDWSGLAGCLTAGAVISADGALYADRAAFIDAMSDILADVRTVHHGFTPEVSFSGPDEADGIWAMEDYLVFPSAGDPIGFRGYGHYHEAYVRVDGDWKISQLLLTRIAMDPLAGGFPAALESAGDGAQS